MKKMMFMSLIFLCICLVPVPGFVCTTFVLNNNGQPIYGKNADFIKIPSYVIVNKRGVAKTSPFFRQEPDAEQISWISKYGSVTFNLLAREKPFEGINEAGLFMSSMSGEGLAKDAYPEPDSRTPFGALSMLQYQLDNWSTVDEVIASFQSIRIPRPKENVESAGTFHWLVADSRGKCASIEFLDGKVVCHTGWTMPVKALANSTYDHSIAYFRRFRFLNLFSPVPIPEDQRPSLLRFAVAGDRVKKYRPKRSGPVVDYAFQILQDVEIYPSHKPVAALWSAVYDSVNKRIYFRSWNNDKIRWFDLDAFDFSCTTPVKVLDVGADLSGDVTNSFVDYTKEIDIAMLKAWYGILSEAEIKDISSYPDSTVCTE